MPDNTERHASGEVHAFTGSRRRRARSTLATCGVTHFVHDGISDSLYVFLPLWAEAFGLNHAQVGLLKTLYSFAMAAFQLPAGVLAERWGQRGLLTAGTLAAALAMAFISQADSFTVLLVLVVFCGLGSGVQHPLSSSLVAAAYEHGPRRAALGAYNFSGDLGKVALPLAVAAVATAASWRESSLLIGGLGIAAALGIYLALRSLEAGATLAGRAEREMSLLTGDWGIHNKRGFSLLSAIAVLDSSVRTGLLTFLPFLLIGKGAEVATVGFALALVFAGGAAGKLLCGLLAERAGIIRTVALTELMTGFGIACLLVLPLTPALVCLPLVGLALNGTSSVLYGTVPEFVLPQRQSRAYGLFYTLGTGALAPLLFGMISDAAGLTVTLSLLAGLALAVLPLAFVLAPSLAVSGPLTRTS